MKRTVSIIGAGEIGLAIQFLLRNARDIELKLWDIDPKKLKIKISLEEAASASQIIFLCVPSWSARSALISLTPYIGAQTSVISLAKGIEPVGGRTSSELLTELMPDSSVGLLHGPMLAEELMSDLSGAAVIGSKDSQLLLNASELFLGSKLKTKSSDDFHGVALTGVLKNVYALGLGMTEALELGANYTGWYIEQALHEMSRILRMGGCDEKTAYGAAGLGDLIATGFSRFSSNHEIGREIAFTGVTTRKSEGLASLNPLVARLEGRLDETPLVHNLFQVIRGDLAAKDSLTKLLHT